MTDQQKTTRVRKTPQTRAQEELDRAKRLLEKALKAQQTHEDALANIRPEVEYQRAQVEHLSQAPALRTSETTTRTYEIVTDTDADDLDDAPDED